MVGLWDRGFRRLTFRAIKQVKYAPGFIKQDKIEVLFDRRFKRPHWNPITTLLLIFL